MGDLLPMSKAAKTARVDRATIARWVANGELTSVQKRMVRNLEAVYVDVAEVKARVAKITVGRPSAKRTRRAKKSDSA